jgi:Na+/melibiose symporter-like transporter
VFLLNLPLAAAVILVTIRHVPESRDASAHAGFDVAGAVLTALALSGITYALIEAPGKTGFPAGPLLAGLLGLAAGVGFLFTERRRTRSPARVTPMLPLDVFGSRQFSVINVITFLVYGAFGGLLFLLVLQLQVVSGFSPLKAGTALLPVTVLMLALSARAGGLAQRIGPRWLLTIGITGLAIGMALMTRIGPHASYAADVLPAVIVFGLGLTMTVAPLTATVLASADVRHAGVASGVNNAVARAGSLLLVAAIPPLTGLTGDAQAHPARFATGFHESVVIGAALLAAGAVLSLLTVRDRMVPVPAARQPSGKVNCAIAAPPLEPGPGTSVAH